MRRDQKHSPETESTIFSEHKSSVEIAEEKKAAKAAEKLRRKEEKARRKEEKKDPALAKASVDPGTRVTVIALIVLAAVVILGIVLIVVNQTNDFNHKEAPDSAHFYSADKPEMSTEGIKGVVNEAYYTNDGSLCLKLTFSNGLSANHYLTSLEVIVKNEDDKTVATGYTDAIPEGYYIEPQNVKTFTFYIESKYVKIPDDDLDNLSYEVSTTGEIDADATVPSTTTTKATEAKK